MVDCMVMEGVFTLVKIGGPVCGSSIMGGLSLTFDRGEGGYRTTMIVPPDWPTVMKVG